MSSSFSFSLFLALPPSACCPFSFLFILCPKCPPLISLLPSFLLSFVLVCFLLSLCPSLCPTFLPCILLPLHFCPISPPDFVSYPDFLSPLRSSFLPSFCISYF
ncbi:hypothetical protein ILYODFUR_003806 [Ilyodon furcidens]|uniref:Uncharacterized protein n=1 Tax=Ilyodon furcidens TaxID=33524 RepID=A0ABV0UD30_9TELE